MVELFLRGSGILEGPFEASFQTCQALLTFTSRLSSVKQQQRQAEGEEEEVVMGADETRAAIEAHLKRIDLTPFHRRRSHHRTAAAIVPALIDTAIELLDKDVKAIKEEAAEEEAPAKAAAEATGQASASDLESEELVLLDLLHAPEGSYLSYLATLMARIENLSHVLAWARFREDADLGHVGAISQSDLVVVSLPRLKLTFQARAVGDSVRAPGR